MHVAIMPLLTSHCQFGEPNRMISSVTDLTAYCFASSAPTELGSYTYAINVCLECRLIFGTIVKHLNFEHLDKN